MLYSKSTGGFYDREIHSDKIPADAVEISEAEHAALLEGQANGKKITANFKGFPVLTDPLPLTDAEIVLGIASAVQYHLDNAAKLAGYDDIKSVVTYADEPSVSKFQNEGKAFRAWRSKVWEKCYLLLDEVKSGTRQPMNADQVIAELPILTLP